MILDTGRFDSDRGGNSTAMKKNTLLSLCVAAIINISFQTNLLSQPQPISVRGRVVDSAGNALPGIHVFAVQGEEETFTNQEGHFILKCWQKAPFFLIVQQDASRKQRFKVNQPRQQQLLRFTVR